MVTESSNQFAPPKSFVADRAPLADTDAAKASRWARLGAAILDLLIFGLPFAPAYAQVFADPVIRAQIAGGTLKSLALFAALVGSGPRFWGGGLLALILWVVTAVLVHRHGQTIGKRIVGIRVVRSDGSRAGFARIFWLRNVVGALISWIPLAGGLYALVDLLWIFGGARRCVHDYIADTIVVTA
jgi:uncharacterized RDD family membrane protein YckC